MHHFSHNHEAVKQLKGLFNSKIAPSTKILVLYPTLRYVLSQLMFHEGDYIAYRNLVHKRPWPVSPPTPNPNPRLVQPPPKILDLNNRQSAFLPMDHFNCPWAVTLDISVRRKLGKIRENSEWHYGPTPQNCRKDHNIFTVSGPCGHEECALSHLCDPFSHFFLVMGH